MSVRDLGPPSTPRLRFRPLTLDDVPALVALDADPAVTAHVSSEPPPDAATFRDEIFPRWRAGTEGTPFGFFAALDREHADAFVGWFHLRPDADGPDVLDLGYRLQRRVWGRGLATEGGRALVAWGFSFPHVRRVTGHCVEAHVASARVLQKCGMRLRARFVVEPDRLPGWDAERRRAVGYAIDRAEFRTSRGR